MTEKPSLKLKLNVGGKAPKSEPQNSPPLQPPSASTPKSGIKLTFGKKSTSATPAPQPSVQSTQKGGNPKPKPARKPKPTPKKRALEEEPFTSSDDEAPLASKASHGPMSKKQRLSINGPAPPPSANRIKKIRAYTSGSTGKARERPLGVGYDSAASDREQDPVITEAIILRMTPGDDCDYLRAAITAGNFGPKKDGGADVEFRWFRSDNRRACVSIRGNHYAAILVDLPCIIEAMKSWFPKSGWMKSTDICQMLMVLGRVNSEVEAAEYPLPPRAKGEFDEKTWQWAHGLTPPMHWVRKRRFRKRISVRTVMEVEAEVEEMLRLDELSVKNGQEPIVQYIDEETNRNDNSDLGTSEGDYDEEDAEGDFDDQYQQAAENPLDTIEDADEDEEAAHARMAEEFEREMMLASNTTDADPTTTKPNPLPTSAASLNPPTPTSTPALPAPSTSTSTPPTPAIPPSAPSPASPSSPSSSDHSDEDEEMDEAQAERAQELQQLKDEVKEVDELIKAEQAKLGSTQNQLLRRRIVDKIKGLQQDRELKLAAVGQGVE